MLLGKGSKSRPEMPLELNPVELYDENGQQSAKELAR